MEIGTGVGVEAAAAVDVKLRGGIFTMEGTLAVFRCLLGGSDNFVATKPLG